MKSLRCMYKSHTMIGKEHITKVVTPSGEIELEQWMKEVQELAVRNKEEEILDKLYEFCKKEIAWLKMRDFKLRKDIDDLGEDEAKQIIKELEQEKRQYKLKIEKESMELALQYYGSRIWEIREWVDYELFNKLYLQGELQLSM